MIVCFALSGFEIHGSTLVYCSEGSPDHFNPQISISGVTYDATNLIYSRLFEFDPKTDLIRPGLAISYQTSKDGKVYTLFLRKKVWFQSRKGFAPSRPFQADDVLFTFNRQRETNHPYYEVSGGGYKFFRSLLLDQLILNIKKVNDYKVEFHLKEPLSLFPSYLAMEFSNILSAEYGDWLIQKGKKGWMDSEPVGTGPFALKRYIKDSAIYYDRYDRHYRGPAKIKKIVFAITPDATVRFQKIKRKECDVIAKPQPLDVPDMKKNRGIQVVEGVSYNVAYLAMNTEKPPLNQVKVRKAIAHALNIPFYVKAIYKGFANPAHSPVPPNLWGSHLKMRTPAYNPKKAKALLKEAGFEKGLSLSLWTLPISRPYNPSGKKMGELMQADLKKVGIDVRLVTYDWPTYLSKSSKGEHELIQMGWTADIGDPSNFLEILLTCPTIKSGSNLARWCDQEYDQLINRGRRISSQKQRARIYKKAQEIFSKAQPWVPLVHAYNFTAISPKVKGYRLKRFGSEKFYPLSISK